MFTMHFYQHIYQNHLLAVWSYFNEKTKTNPSKKVNIRCKIQRQRHSAKPPARLMPCAGLIQNVESAVTPCH